MTAATQILDVARGQIGQGENPRGSNRTKYGEWYGLNPAAWCSMFVCWCFAQSGGLGMVAGAKTARGSAYSGDILEHFRSQGRVSMTARMGDLVIWDWPNAGTLNDHIGFVELVYANGSLGTIEGNSPGLGFVYDVVGRHVRHPTRYVRGFCHPVYSGAPSPLPAPTPRPNPPPVVQPNEEDLEMRGRIIQCKETGEHSNADWHALGWFFAICDPTPVKWHVPGPTSRFADYMRIMGFSSNNFPDQIDNDIFDSFKTVG